MAKAVERHALGRADVRVSDETSPAATRRLTVVRASLDMAAILTAIGAALFFRFRLGFLAVSETGELTVRAHLLAAWIWLVAMLAGLAWNRLYDEDTLFKGGGELSRVAGSILHAVAVMSVFVFLTQSFYVSRSWLGMTVVLTAVTVAGMRLVVRARIARARARGRLLRPAFLVSREGDQWPEWRDGADHEFVVRGRHDAASFEAMIEDVTAGAAEVRDAAVILRARDFGYDEFWRIVLLSGGLGWTVYVHSPVRSVTRDRLAVREVGGHTMVRVRPPMLTGWRAVQKRGLDLVGSVFLLVILSPVLVALGLAVLLSSGRPVLYRQERVGLNGRSFTMLKFRTMRRDAEAASGPVWAAAGDDRRTRIGRWLRRTSLDELPQLLNVAVGQMSLIGPRPERPFFVTDFKDRFEWYTFRHRIRPGMTGWAQAHGLRGDTSLDRRVDFDNWYIENWSIALDLKIAVRTLVEVVRGTNAD